MNDITTTTVWPGPGVPAVRSRGGLPLQGVRATGRLDGLLFELSVEQRYSNESDRVIEAVFTFPVPVRAVLLGLELELGDRKLKALAIAKAAATEKYERAIDDGDAAVLLESVGNGLYTVSVGNLKPGESAVIRYRHAELLDANRGLLRLQVPTVIAPRYGNPASAGLEGPAVPEADPVAEYPFELEIVLAGIQDDTSLESPTHSIRTHRTEAGTTVRLAKAATLDRDFVLEVPQANLPKGALVAPDGDEWVVVASAVLEGLAESERRALALTVLLDCSGSMQGDSIEAAKRAVGRVLDNLGSEDRLGLLRFGSEFQWVTEGVAPCSRAGLTALKSAVRGIDADLGGTEMRAALEAALHARLPAGEAGGDLLLITDGQVHELDALVGLVAKARRRLFVVAVGSAPNEALARKLSETTGGACEFVASGELAEDAIVRMFRRMRALPRRVGKVQWPEAVAWQLAAPRAVFPDETVHLVAGLTSMPVGRVRIAVGEAADAGGVRVIEVPVLATNLPAEVASTIVRVAGARRVALLAEKDETAAAAALAERLQIASAFTSFVVVAERSAEEKALGLPATVKVPQMLAAGFGGMARVEAPMMSAFGLRKAAAAAPAFRDFHVQYCRSFDAPSKPRGRGIDSEADLTAEHLEGGAPAPETPVSRVVDRLREKWLDQDFVTTDEIREAAAQEALSKEQIEEVISQFLGIWGPVLRVRPESADPTEDELEDLGLDDPAEVLRLVLEPRQISPVPTEPAPVADLGSCVSSMITAARGGAPRPETLEALRSLGVPEGVLQELKQLAQEAGAREVDVVTTFLAVALSCEGVSPAVATEIGKIWSLGGSIWTRGAQRKLRAAIRERVFES